MIANNPVVFTLWRYLHYFLWLIRNASLVFQEEWISSIHGMLRTSFMYLWDFSVLKLQLPQLYCKNTYVHSHIFHISAELLWNCYRAGKKGGSKRSNVCILYLFFFKVLFLIWCLNSKIRKSNVMICLLLLRSFFDGERSYLMLTHLSSDCVALSCFANRNANFSGVCANSSRN